MNINVKPEVRDHFWEEPPEGHTEFWSFGRFKPACKVGDTLNFRFDGVIVATAVVSLVQPPGNAVCERTGKYRHGWKVYWTNESFKDLRKCQSHSIK